ncbi:hypothetical protein COLO4_27050 [Corchorus olitorius]|uniref:Uncharacterized protein n=1 Tax=Corchorus olitorius TaxID=93759 RepID=A0A1R3HT70_9ROSI|nr:hypothetical protein COLO4_27050 [Corchorus olitorius]
MNNNNFYQLFSPPYTSLPRYFFHVSGPQGSPLPFYTHHLEGNDMVGYVIHYHLQQAYASVPLPLTLPQDFIIERSSVQTPPLPFQDHFVANGQNLNVLGYPSLVAYTPSLIGNNDGAYYIVYAYQGSYRPYPQNPPPLPLNHPQQPPQSPPSQAHNHVDDPQAPQPHNDAFQDPIPQDEFLNLGNIEMEGQQDVGVLANMEAGANLGNMEMEGQQDVGVLANMEAGENLGNMVWSSCKYEVRGKFRKHGDGGTTRCWISCKYGGWGKFWTR